MGSLADTSDNELWQVIRARKRRDLMLSGLASFILATLLVLYFTGVLG